MKWYHCMTAVFIWLTALKSYRNQRAEGKGTDRKDADQADQSARKEPLPTPFWRPNTSGDMEHLKLRFDSMASHDITFVGIVQTAKASGMETFPIPYVLTNCHNTLCAVGGTINEDDHMFGLSAAKKYGASMFLRILRSFIST